MRATIVALALLAIGCSGEQTASQEEGKASTPTAVSAEQPPRNRVSDRPGNTNGVVFVAMYHRVMEKEGSYARSKENFKKDLQRLYDMGFRPVTMTEYIDNAMNLAPGASPIVMTWDDSTENQFRYLPDGQIDPDCAIGMWMAFAKDHPDFPVKGSFYVNANGPFEKDGQKKVDQLLAWGCDVDSHTMTHEYLDRVDDTTVMKELAGMQDYLREKGVKNPRVLCLPFGLKPDNRALMREFEYNGKTYRHEAALLVGSNPAPSPNSPKRDLYAIPRIQAYDGEQGLTYWLDQVESGKVNPFVQP
jgi:hypothetical protein